MLQFEVDHLKKELEKQYKKEYQYQIDRTQKKDVLSLARESEDKNDFFRISLNKMKGIMENTATKN